MDCPNSIDFREPHCGGTWQHATQVEADAYRGRCPARFIGAQESVRFLEAYLRAPWPAAKHHDGGFTT